MKGAAFMGTSYSLEKCILPIDKKATVNMKKNSYIPAEPRPASRVLLPVPYEADS